MQKSVLLLCALLMGAGMLFAAEPQISRDGWEVGLKTDGFHIRRNGAVLTEGTMCGIVAGPQWKPVIDNAAFASAVRDGNVKRDGDRQLSVTVQKESSRGVLSVEILDAKRLRISWTIDTDLPTLADTTVWFLGLPQDDFALGSAAFGKDKSIILLCRTDKAETRKSLWRLTPDVKEMTITGKSGRLKVSGTYFHLFDARFHPFPPKMRTFCLRSAPVTNRGTAEFIIEFDPMKELVPRAVTGSAAQFYLDCKGTLIPLRPGENELVFDLPPSDVPVLAVTGSDGEERRYTGVGGNVKFDFRKDDSALRAASASGTGGPFPVLADDSAEMLAETGRRLAGLNGKFPAAALEEEREQLLRLSADKTVPRTPAELAAKRQSYAATIFRSPWRRCSMSSRP